MGNSTSAAVPVLCAGVVICAIELVHFLDPHPDPGAGAAEAAQAPALGSAVRAFLPLSASWGFFIASVALMYRHHLQRAGAADAGNRRLSERVPFVLCPSAGLLEFFLFVVQAPGGGGADRSAAARELGRATLRALPAAATATFFLSMLMIIVGHIRAGGEGGGTAVSGNGPIEAPTAGVLTKMAVGAAAGLAVALMAMAALYGAL